MLSGIHPLLSGSLLHHLDEMGHSEAVVIVDAHFPARGLATRLVELPGTSATVVVAAIRTVLPLDDVAPLDLMAAPGGPLPIHQELTAASGLEVGRAAFVERYEFYERAAAAYLIVRTGEQRTYANALVRKGIVV
ncbi:MAG TPA: RbsD/FucU domain-containing protein [Pseudolysinimonas sp.]